MTEVGKIRANFERTDRSWKVFLSRKVSPQLESSNELGKFSLKLESVIAFNKMIIKVYFEIFHIKQNGDQNHDA